VSRQTMTASAVGTPAITIEVLMLARSE